MEGRKALAMRRMVSLAVTFSAVATGGCRCDRGGPPTPAPAVSVSPTASPASLEEATPGFSQIAAGKDMTCARTAGGEVMCWGDNAFTTTTMSASSVPAPLRTGPVHVSGVSDAVDLDVASSHGCAVTKSGSVSCWVDRTSDHMSKGVRVALQASPIAVADAVSVRSSVASMATFCFVHRDGGVSCARADRGSLPADAKRADGLTSVAAVEPGDLHTCALKRADAVVCWGSNLMGGLGHQDASSSSSPLGAAPILEGATSLTTGSGFSCAVKEGKAFCWGSSDSGQAGVRRDTAPVPTAVPDVQGVRAVRAGVYHACAVVGDEGYVRCWGDDRFGQLGARGGNVEGIVGATEVAAGEWHSCALTKSGKIACWGRNHRGQLGDGTSKDSRLPRPVIVKR